METRALPFGIKIEIENVFETDFSKGDISGVLFQYPDTEGSVLDFEKVVEKAVEVVRGHNVELRARWEEDRR